MAKPSRSRRSKSRTGLIHRTTTDAAHIYQQHRHSLPYSDHAVVRAAQRSIPRWVVDLAHAHGRMVYGEDCQEYFLGRRQIERLIQEKEAFHGPLSGAERARLYDLEGTLIRCSHKGGQVITLFTNPHYRHLERAGVRRFHRRPRRRLRLPG